MVLWTNKHRTLNREKKKERETSVREKERKYGKESDSLDVTKEDARRSKDINERVREGGGNCQEASIKGSYQDWLWNKRAIYLGYKLNGLF